MVEVAYVAILLLPTMCLFAVAARRIFLFKKNYDPAIGDKLRNPPGESLRIKVADLNDKFTEQLMWLGLTSWVVPVLAVLFTNGTPEASRTILRLTVGVMLFPASVYLAIRLWKTFDLLRRYTQGFKGERHAGELLNLLMKDGHDVFHDVPMGDYNVDHVVLTRNAVFAVETKSRSKLKSLGRDKAKVTYDGQKLIWPDGKTNDYGLKNAVDRARGLSQWLSQATGETVEAIPVLAFPGWFINVQAHQPVHVINPKNMAGVIRAYQRQPAFSDSQYKRIYYQLTQRCTPEE